MEESLFQIVDNKSIISEFQKEWNAELINSYKKKVDIANQFGRDSDIIIEEEIVIQYFHDTGFEYAALYKIWKYSVKHEVRLKFIIDVESMQIIVPAYNIKTFITKLPEHLKFRQAPLTRTSFKHHIQCS